MQHDPSYQNTLMDYALRFIRIYRNDGERPLQEFVFAILGFRERARYVRSLRLELDARHARLVSAEASSGRSMPKPFDMESIEDELTGDADDFVRPLFSRLYTKHPRMLGWTLRYLKSRLQHLIATRSLNGGNPDSHAETLAGRLEKLRQTFELTDHERDVLLFFHMVAANEPLNDLVSSSAIKMNSPAHMVRNFCRFFGLDSEQLRKILSKDSALLRSGLVQRVRGETEHYVTTSASMFLSGVAGQDLSMRYFTQPAPRTPLEIGDFPMPDAQVEAIASLLRGQLAVNLLLHGPPGTGKTEFARVVAESIGAEPVFLCQTDDDGDEDLARRKSALVAAQTLLRRGQVLIVDECDPILNTNPKYSFLASPSKDDAKSWINQYLETSRIRMIWISNQTSGIDPSTRRRFSYVQPFRAPEKEQRRRAWEIQAAKQNATFLTPDAMAQLAQQYTLSPGNLELAIRDTLATAEGRSPDEQLARLRTILDQKQLFCEGKRAQLAPIAQSYDLSGLNTDIPLERVCDELRRFTESAKGSGATSALPNWNLLLLGPPGTGKTEFAKYSASSLGKDLIVKRASDLISPWVGMTERNIAEAFAMAEERGAILFIDEADTMFRSRESAHRSWEVSQTNELLCQMENFRGILICATNFHAEMDMAAMRRFARKVRFDYLTHTGAVHMFNRILGPVLGRTLSPMECEQLKGVGALAPGDFKVVLQSCLIEERVEFQELADALQREARSRAAWVRRPVMGLV